MKILPLGTALLHKESKTLGIIVGYDEDNWYIIKWNHGTSYYRLIIDINPQYPFDEPNHIWIKWLNKNEINYANLMFRRNILTSPPLYVLK